MMSELDEFDIRSEKVEDSVRNCRALDVERQEEDAKIMEQVPSNPVPSSSASVGNESEKVDVLVEELNGLLKEDDENKQETISPESPRKNGVRPDLGEEGGEELSKMSKFYQKFSLQCQEIESLEKRVQQLQDQCSLALREKDAFLSQIRDLNRSHSSKVQELEKRITDGESAMKIVKDRSIAQENHFRKMLHDQETKYNAQIEQLKKSADNAHREKDSAVIKYASREKDVLTSEANQRKMQQQLSQITTEKEALSSRLRGAKNEKEQLVQVLNQKDSEITDWKRKYEDVKNFIQEADIKMKLADKKVEDVENAHKETKTELERMVKKLKESKEENLTIKSNCQDMIKQFHESVESKRVEVEIQRQEHTDQEEIYKVVLDELDALKKQHKSTLLEYEQRTEAFSFAEKRLAEKDSKIAEMQILIDSKQSEISRLSTEIVALRQHVDELETETRKSQEQERKMKDLIMENLDLESEANVCRKSAESMLELTQKLSDKNSQLHSENCSLLSKILNVERLNQELTPLCESLKSQIPLYEHELTTLKATTSRDMDELSEKLKQHEEKERELSTLYEDERNQCRILKKKHAAGLKELKSEVAVLKRRLESYESGTASQCSGGSAGDEQEHFSSRSPSMTSLETVGVGAAARVPGGGESPNDTHSVHSHHSVNCEHNQAMIEKIVKLQRMLARRSEKIEFMEDHNKNLIEELRKKSRIIQSYALREETGALTPESVDLNKLLEYTDQAQLAKKGQTVMGSVFGTGKGGDATITSELSVQIMRKLQAVLEDALLKNITLKENVDTLADEISKLSRENRSLNLQLQRGTSKGTT